MRYASACLILLLCQFVNTGLFAQTIIINEDFSDGDFTTNPTWTDHKSKHIVSAGSLHLDAPSKTDEAIITTVSSAAYGEWEALVELDFNPSGNNLSRIYIISDTENIKDEVEGYFIQIGDTEDEVSLYRQDGFATTKIIDGTDDMVNSNPVSVRMRVTRDLDGNWELFADPAEGTSFTSQGTTTDNTYSLSNYLGLFSDYTSTRSDLFAYDDITVTKITPPLAIQNTDAVDDRTIDVVFNLDIDPASITTSDFSLNNGVGSPDAANLAESNVVRLKYNSPILSNKYTLTVSNIDDIDGNTINPNTPAKFNLFGTFEDGDIIINEFVYDYPPLLSEEYIEIKNVSGKYLNIANWQIADNNSSSALGADPIPVEANSFLAISADTTELYEIFGNRNYHEASFPALNNTTPDAVQLITASGTLADSLTYNSDWGGTDVALERRSASTPSIYQDNWGNSPNPDGGSPGAPNEIAADNTPPELLSFEITSKQTLRLAFDERISNPGNYNINNSSIAAVDQPAADTVELSLGSDLQDAQEYTLFITDTEDIFGNTTNPIDTSFTFYEPSPVDSGDVAINEFMYAPSPVSSEYIELYNHSNNSLDLQGWTLSDNRQSFEGTITNSQFIVPPDSYIVIAPDNTIEEDYPDISLLSMSDFPALNNGGDQIIIRDQNDNLLDSLQYNSDWGGDEVALERKSTSISSTFPENWGNAPNGFGTPGSTNQIESDETPPSLTNFIIENANTLKLIFSENIDPSSATSDRHYKITPHRNAQLISVNNNTITLFLDEELTSGKTYEVAISGIADTFGNTISEVKAEAEFLKIEDPEYGDIVINEFLYNPGPDGADFIELYNRSNKNIELSNWIIGDISTKTSISKNIQLRAKSYVVFTGSHRLPRLNDNIYSISGFPALNNNTPDAIYLRDRSGLTVDSLRYHQNWDNDAEGASLERLDPGRASNDASNWQTNNSEDGHSAGTKNATFQEDNNPPEITFAKVLPDGDIQVQFSEFIRLTEETRFFSDNQELQVIRFDSTNANTVVLAPESTQKAAANNTAITAQNISDVKGNVTSNSEIVISQPMKPSDLVINEIMFNPLDDSDDNKPDQSEYIELRNTRDYAVSLEGVVLHDAPDENGEIRALHPVSTTAKWVPPEEHVLFYADEAVAFEDSKVATFFELGSPDQSVMRIDRSTLSLASTDDAIYLADSTGAVIDSVFYDEAWHNPNIIDTRGVALERVNPGGPSHYESNWGSSVNGKGGTPTSENSIYQDNSKPMQEMGISFTPNPFSPDSDGYEDNLFINYNLDHQDYLIDVQIYDRYGRPVRELADGKQAGFKGQLIWDGLKDDRSRNRIGIYIVVFEAYDSSSGSDQAFKETVVLARKLN